MIEKYSQLVQCTFCNKQYDLCTVTVIQRYADCSTWKSPCCGRFVDDRLWKSLPDYREIKITDNLFGYHNEITYNRGDQE